MTKATVMMAVAGLAIAGSAYADSDWANAVNGSYGIANNWNPADVPDTALETATLGLSPNAYIVTIDGVGVSTPIVEGLVISNPAAQLDIQGARSMTIAGGVFANAGLVFVNSNNSAANATLRFDSSTATSGAGRILLGRSTNARIETGVGAVFTNNATIDGLGVVAAALVNNGLVESNSSSTLELNTNDMVNTSIMRAAAGSTLRVGSITIDNTGGLLEAVDGTLFFPSGTPRVESGTIGSSGLGQSLVEGGCDLTLSAVTQSGTMNIQGAGDVFIEGGLTNNGTVAINSNNSAANARLVFTNTGTVAGSGTLRLGRNSNAILATDPGATATIGASQTVSGLGNISAELINNGLIDADTAGGHVVLAGGDKTNNGVMRARNGGTLNITGVTTTQGAAGVIRADGGTIRIASGSTGVTNGDIEVVNGGLAVVEGSGNLTLTNVDLLGGLNIEGAGTVILGSTLTNNAFLFVNSNNSAANAVLTTAGNVAVDGTGTIRLGRNTNAILSTAAASTLTVGSGQTISGMGQIQAALVNNGMVDADTAGGTIRLNTENKTNNNLMRATGTGTLDITGVTTTQAPGGVMRADNGLILVTNAATRVEEGTLETLNGGLVRVQGSGHLTLDDVDFSGDLHIEGAGTVVIDSTMRNDGSVFVDSNNSAANAILTTAADASVTGTGTILLGRNTNAQLNTADGATLTLGAGQTVRGGGLINATLVNSGLVDADTAGMIIDLRTGTKTNNGTMRATLGILDITASTTNQTAAGAMIADGGTIRTSGASRIEDGALNTLNGGQVLVASSGDLTLRNVTLDGMVNMEGAGDVFVENTLTNNGLMMVNSNNSAANSILSVANGGSLSGAGEVRLGRVSNAILTTPGTANFRAGQTLSGVGTISGTWTYRGTISPGTSAGTITNSGTINMLPTAQFDLELASTSTFDRFTGTGSADLDGTLNVSFDGYTPVKNHVFRFMTGSAITGTFAEVNGPALPDGLVYGIFYDPTFVELRITCGPDLNLDGLLDFFDVQFFLQAFAAGDPEGDFNEDGLFDFFDVLAFLNAFSTGCP